MTKVDKGDRRSWPALRVLAEQDTMDGASADVEMHLVEHVRAIGRARRRRTAVLSVGVAAALVVSVMTITWRTSSAPSMTAVHTDARVEAVLNTRAAAESEFLPLIYSNVPMSNGWIVRMEVRRMALVSFGLPPGALEHASSDTVLADVLVGEDGLARGVRFVRSVAP